MITVRVFRNGVADEGTIEPTAIADCLADDDHAFVWFDAPEPSQQDIDALAKAFGLHPLTLEDIEHAGSALGSSCSSTTGSSPCGRSPCVRTT